MTRFAPWPRWAAGLLLAAMAALVIATPFMNVPNVAASSAAAEAAHFSDVRLYRAVADRVAAGEDYYVAAAAEQRGHGYPTAPAQVIREPTETFLLVALGNDTLRRAALLALAAVTAFALWRALGDVGLSPRLRLWGLVLMLSGLANALEPTGSYMHENWAALLIALSLALRRPDRWVASICVGVLACLFRELALPYLLAMAAMAFLDRRWREGLAWIGGMAVFGGLFAVHLALAGAQHRPGDIVSAGWVHFSGWPFVIDTAQWNAILVQAPSWLVAAAICLSAVGLAGDRRPMIARTALIVIGYLAAFAVVGRPDNNYWGILYAPLLPLGLVLAPAAMKDLLTRAAPAIGRKLPGLAAQHAPPSAQEAR